MDTGTYYYLKVIEVHDDYIVVLKRSNCHHITKKVEMPPEDVASASNLKVDTYYSQEKIVERPGKIIITHHKMAQEDGERIFQTQN